MRSIGKKNIAIVKRITQEEMLKNKIKNVPSFIIQPDYSKVEDSVIERLPESLWDTWESADSEIHSIINDEIMAST